MDAALSHTDTRLLILMVLFGYVLAFLTLTLTWRAYRQIPGIHFWWAASLMALAGLTGFVVGTQLTLQSGLWAGNLFLLLHAALMLAGVRAFLQLPNEWQRWCSGLLLLLGLLGLSHWLGMPRASLLLMAIAFSGFGAMLIWQLARHEGRDYRLVMPLLGLVTLSLTLFVLINTLLMSGIPLPWDHRAAIITACLAMLVAGYLTPVGVLLLCIQHHTLALRQQATHDPLTGLYNRRGLHQRMRTLMERAPLMVAMMDLDDFKQINDRFGHEMGDRVLQGVGRQLQRLPGTVAARIGGEEFVLLTHLDEEQSYRLCEQLCAEIALLSFGEVRVTASLGVDRILAGERLEAALKRADLALYRAKRLGKNRVCGSECLDKMPSGL
ncbi:GGDEF domain-containing protein [Aeromonas schubertii]|uniref:diguanylate cyclase n=1 Tax=Aeromonas schubertii TaxID=652 RepID=A0A0S2SLA7_9GAMM|nr:GGDEF domain-containing protein [Aeromonas schubertii]ALP42520.1 hypothetical protein WL1483_3101 [Aeromonas schubertii]QCG48483.1 GGDEF domain-containing protein [Aeromonas schubertii]